MPSRHLLVETSMLIFTNRPGAEELVSAAAMAARLIHQHLLTLLMEAAPPITVLSCIRRASAEAAVKLATAKAVALKPGMATVPMAETLRVRCHPGLGM